MRSIICSAAFFCLPAMGGLAQTGFTKDADIAFDKGLYFSATELYKKAYSKERNNTSKTRIIFRIGECYRFIGDTKQSEIWYRKAIKVLYPDPIAILYYADALKANGKYEDALIEYKSYSSRVPDDERGPNGVKSCELAQEWMDTPSRYEVVNVIQINSPSSDFSPLYARRDYREVIFTSSREGSTGTEIDGIWGQNFTDLWTTKIDRKGNWSTPVPLDENVNSADNEGAGGMNDNARSFYFTRCPRLNNQKSGCQILLSEKKGQSWEKPEVIALGPDTSAIGHPALMNVGRKPDGNSKIIFSSDMPGGSGGKDLWVSTYDEKAKRWGAPENLGTEINTSGNEMFPFIRDDGTLYFASDGHPGMGGLDIFKTTRKDDKWVKVANMQYPINSEGDDFGIIFEGNANRGMFSSNRKGGKGGDDIYQFFSPDLTFTLQGVVIDAETREILPGSLLKLTGDDGTSQEIATDEVGSYFFQIKGEVNYSIAASKEKYLSEEGKVTTVGLDASKDLVHDFELKSIRKPIELPNILYDLDKWDLRPESKVALDGLIKTLNENPNITIMIMSHTDSRADDKYNIELSQKRAQSVVDYLISSKIPSDRLEAKGYGESKPLISDSKIRKMKTEEEQEAAHQKNRRTEFKVLRTDYVPKTQGKYIEVEPPK